MTTGFDDNLDELAEAEASEWAFDSRLAAAVKAERERVLDEIETWLGIDALLPEWDDLVRKIRGEP